MFVTRKKKSAKFGGTSTSVPLSSEDDMTEYDWVKAAAAVVAGNACGGQHQDNDSPASDPNNEQCLSVCPVQAHVPPHHSRFLCVSFTATLLPFSVLLQTQSDNSCPQRFFQMNNGIRGYDEKNLKVPKRKKNKDKKLEVRVRHHPSCFLLVWKQSCSW